VNVGKPIHGAAANAVKSTGFPNPRSFASNKYSRYPPMAPKMIGNLRQIPGAATAIKPTIRTVSSPIQVRGGSASPLTTYLIELAAQAI
jgi:hypothetical protein